MLKVENLNLTLGNKHVLQDINLSIPIQGEIIGIMGLMVPENPHLLNH